MKIVKLDRRFNIYEQGFIKAVYFENAYGIEYDRAWELLEEAFPGTKGKYGSWFKYVDEYKIYIHKTKPRWIDRDTGKRTYAPFGLFHSSIKKILEPIYICFRDEKDLLKYLLYF